MKHIFIRALLSLAAAACALTQHTYAQKNPSDANIYGHVIDKATGEHLPYVTVLLAGTTVGTTTDASGHYFLKNLPVGNFTLRVQAVGYRTEERPVAIAARSSQEVNFEIAEQQISLDEVVVSASRSATLRKQAPALVNVVNADLFEKVGAACLAEGLGFQPGVRVEDDCQNCGFAQVRINGLDGHYSQILVDSHPIFSSLTGVYGLEQIPASMIERVEVLRGGGSALFGSSAIGGTINIITRDPLRNSGEFSHSISSIGGSSSYDNNTALNASLVTDNRKAGLYLYGQLRHRSGYDRDGDGFTELPQLESQSVGLRSFLRTGTYSRLTLQYHHIDEYRRGGDLLDLPPHEALVAEQTDHGIDGGSLSFDYSSDDRSDRLNLYASFQNTARKSYYGGNRDLAAYGHTHDLTFAAGAQYVHEFGRLLFLPAELTIGAEYSYDDLQDESVGYDHRTDQTVHIVSAYAQNEWKNEKWSLLIGCRLDKHSMIDRPIASPRANLRYNPDEQISLRLSYAGGFRAPQAFDEDMHIAVVGGDRVRILLADGLEEERSHSVSLSADIYRQIGSVETNLLVEGFHTELNDAFDLRETAVEEDGTRLLERYNSSGARVTGLNVEAKAAFTRWFQLQAGITWQRSRYKEPQHWSDDETVAPERRMFRTPDLYGYLTAELTPVKGLDIDLSGTYTGRMLVQHMAGSGVDRDTAVTTPHFFDLGIKAAYEFTLYRQIRIQLHAGVRNLFDAYQRDFDRGADRDSGYIYGPSIPRSWVAGIKVSF